MDNVFMFELKRFAKDNIKKILGLSLGIAILYIVLQLLFSSFFPNNSETEQVVNTEYAPSSFKIFIEEQDGTVFTNSTLIKEYFFLQRNVQKLEEETNTDIRALIEQSIEDGSITSAEELITFVRYANSSLFEMVVSSSDEAKNLQIAEYYHDLFFDNEIPFLKNKEIFEFTEPKLLEEEEAPLEEVSPHRFNLREGVMNSVIGFAIGLFIVTLCYLVKALFSSKITYAFAYDWDQETLFNLSARSLENEKEITHFLAHPTTGSKLILHDQPLPAYLQSYATDASFTIATSVAEVDPKQTFNEVILILSSGKTTRRWYQKQRVLLKNYQARMKLIQHVD